MARRRAAATRTASVILVLVIDEAVLPHELNPRPLAFATAKEATERQASVCCRLDALRRLDESVVGHEMRDVWPVGRRLVEMMDDLGEEEAVCRRELADRRGLSEE